MIDQTQEQLVNLLISSFLLGLLLGTVYEVIRFVKMFFGVRYGKNKASDGHKGAGAAFIFVLTFISDFLFCILFALVAISLTYSMSGGVFRGMVYIGLFCGILLYYFTLGRLMLIINSKLTAYMRKMLIGAVKILLIPLRGVFLLFRNIYRLTMGKIIGKIKERAGEKRRKKEKLLKGQNTEGNLLPECIGEEEKNVDKENRYRKAERISFGKYRL